jgi:hypothetical protein
LNLPIAGISGKGNSGSRRGKRLQVCVEAGGMEHNRVIAHAGTLYSAGVIGLFPIREALAVGRP